MYSVWADSSPPQPHVGTRRAANPARAASAAASANPAQQGGGEHQRDDVIEGSPAGGHPEPAPHRVRRRLQVAAATQHAAEHAQDDAREEPQHDAQRPRAAPAAPASRRAPRAPRPLRALRGSARKLIPNAFTKHAAARAVVSASSAPPTGNRKWTSGSVSRESRTGTPGTSATRWQTRSGAAGRRSPSRR